MGGGSILLRRTRTCSESWKHGHSLCSALSPAIVTNPRVAQGGCIAGWCGEEGLRLALAFGRLGLTRGSAAADPPTSTTFSLLVVPGDTKKMSLYFLNMHDMQ